MRTLTLDRDALLDLTTDELREIAAAGGLTGPGLSKLVGCNTADSWCEISQGC